MLPSAKAYNMGIFQRFEDEVPSIFVAAFVAFITLIVVLPLTLYVFSLIPAGNSFLKWDLSIIITFSATGAAAAITLGKLRKP